MSNEEPEATGTPDIDQNVRAAVAGAAERVDMGEIAESLGDVRATAHRRRRRRNALVGTAAAATLVVGGVVVANVVSDDGDGDERIVSAPATDPVVTTAEADGDDDAPADTAPVDSTAPVSAPVAPAVEVASADVATAETIAPADSFVLGSYQQMLPWHDGFLVVGQTQPQQELPAELSDEINAAFPPEVIEFFEEAGGLPPTINEATTMLQEAGLYDIVAEVVLGNPEVSEAIYSVPIASPEPFARMSPDGISWTDIDLEIPSDAYGDRRFFSTGDRLVVISLEYDEGDVVAEPAPYEPRAAAIVVQSSTDLETWSVQRTDIGSDDAALPGYIFENTYLSNVAINDDGWVATVETYRDVNYDALLPDDFDRSFMDSRYGWGIYHDADGLVFDFYDDVGGSEQQRVSWSELGFDDVPPGVDVQFDNGMGGGTAWSAPWDGEPTGTTLDGFGYGPMIGFDGGFIRQGDGLSFSVDGAQWTDFDNPDATDWVSAFMVVPDGLIGFAQSGDGATQVYRLDVPSLTWTAVDEPAVPDGFSPWSNGAVDGLLYSIESHQYDEYGEYPEMEPFEMSVQNTDFVLDGLFEEMTQSYTVTDVATGEIVVSESVGGVDFAQFEYLVEVGDGIEIMSPETGEVVTVFTADDLAAMVSSAEDAPAVTSVAYEEAPADLVYEQPQLNVLATNGEVWINQELDLTTGDEATDPTVAGGGWAEVLYPSEVVVNNGIVLVSMSDGSFVRFTF